ncbi:WDR87 [Branchiostoma lanceolatum]|uniref:WDR87 protein n=1 Tax=Branchiostoma lanceolatum TaxID=7740 RepID=A0A8K0ETB8_BRALA|nr:WDR87 [Branchiostoma lanceolatum]
MAADVQPSFVPRSKVRFAGVSVNSSSRGNTECDVIDEDLHSLTSALSELEKDFQDEEKNEGQNEEDISAAGREQLSSDGGLVHDEEKAGRESVVAPVSEDTSGRTLVQTVIPYGFQHRQMYEHNKKLTDVIDVTFNGRLQMFSILDTRGITCWYSDVIVGHPVVRSLHYPKYMFNVIKKITFSKKYNVYFTLGKDFSLKVYNKNFDETCSVENHDLKSVLFMLWNPGRDELITGGVGGTKVWQFTKRLEMMADIRPMSNYRLVLKHEWPNVGGSWARYVQLDLNMQHLYCCTETDLYCYSTEGQQLYKILRAHKTFITGCQFSQHAKLLVTSSHDFEVKVWSIKGGLVHVFRGHSRGVTQLVLHPATSALVLTSSLDGTVKIWSLDTMDIVYSVSLHKEGIQWMGLTNDNLLYCASPRRISTWYLNHVVDFWAHARCRARSLTVVPATGKSKRVMLVGDDSSVRLFSRKERKNLSTVLPPPSISPFQQVECVAYNRTHNMAFLLINPWEIWAYTTKSDPACRHCVWDTVEIQEDYVSRAKEAAADIEKRQLRPSNRAALRKLQQTEKATYNGWGHQDVVPCTSLGTLQVGVEYWTENGRCCPRAKAFLLMGMQDGRVLFMDVQQPGAKHLELQANKDAIIEVYHDTEHNCLVTRTRQQDTDVLQFFSLPELTLIHMAKIGTDVVAYARIGSSLLCGCSSGQLDLITLTEHEEETTTPEEGDNESQTSSEGSESRRLKAEHSSAVLSVDACHNMGIFCTCSGDGAVKIWDSQKVLVTEITLDDSLSCACFLNNRADLLVAYKHHIFTIPHRKVCPSLTVPEVREEDLETESLIYEDPSMLYDGDDELTEPTNLNTYLVPFENLQGKMNRPQTGRYSSTEVESVSSDLSLAPTEMYMSPCSTPRAWSEIDLVLSADVSTQDLKDKERALSQTGYHQSEDSRPGTASKEFNFPRYGKSPGPSPPGTPDKSKKELTEAEKERIQQVLQKWVTPQDEPDDVSVSYEDFMMQTEEEPQPKPKKKQTAKLKAKAKSKDPPLKLSEAEDGESKFKQASKIDIKSIMKTDKKPKSAPGGRSSLDAAEKLSQQVEQETRPRSTATGRKKIVKKERKAQERKTSRRGKSAVQQVEDSRPASAHTEEEEEMDDAKEEEKDEADEEAVQVPSEADSEGVSDTLDPQVPPGTPAAPATPVRSSSPTSSDATQTSGLPVAAPSEASLSDGAQPASELVQSKPSSASTRRSLHSEEGGTMIDEGEDFLGFLEQEKYSANMSEADLSRRPSVSASMASLKSEGGSAVEDMYQAPASKIIISSKQGTVESVRPQTSSEDITSPSPGPESDHDEGSTARPNTAASGFHVSFKSASPDLSEGRVLIDYRELPRNDGLKFDDNWQDRAIERYQLLKLQKQQRMEAAKERRAVLELRQWHKRRSLLGHHDCHGEEFEGHGYVSKSDSSLHILPRPQTAAAFMDPISRMSGEVRPDVSQVAPPTQQPRKPVHKEGLGLERPFRISMRPQSGKSYVRKEDVFETENRSASEPLLIRRPRSSKSIPSKCNRFVLLSTGNTPDVPKPEPTPLEARLLAQRFPQRTLPIQPRTPPIIRRKTTPASTYASRRNSVPGYATLHS